MVVKLVEWIFKLGPLIFGLGFLAPLSYELMMRLNMDLPFGASAWLAALGIGGGLGLIAQVRGSWIWQR